MGNIKISDISEGQKFVLSNKKTLIKTVEKVSNDIVYFTDNSRTTIDSLNEKWESYKNEIEDMNRFEQLQKGISIGVEDNSGPIRRIEVGDPRNNMPTSPIDIPPVYQGTMAKDAYGNPIDVNTAGLHPDTIRQIEEQKQRQLAAQQQIQAQQTGQDPSLNALFGNDVVQNYNQQLQNNNTTQQPQNQQQYVSKLPKMKYTQKVQINLELNEMIPKIEDIKAVENVFDISVIDELAKEISTRLLSNPTILEGMIISELEKLTKKTKKVKPVVKPVKKKSENINITKDNDNAGA
jgi:hypothetical protein